MLLFFELGCYGELCASCLAGAVRDGPGEGAEGGLACVWGWRCATLKQRCGHAWQVIGLVILLSSQASLPGVADRLRDSLASTVIVTVNALREALVGQQSASSSINPLFAFARC